MHGRPVLALTLVTAVLVLSGGAAASRAAPGSLRVLLAANILSELDPGLVSAIAAEPGVGTVDTFDTSAGVPSAATLATYDLVISVGDTTYHDPAAWGNELADYLDAGGAVIQFAYDNWDQTGTHPTGRFESGGYAPFVLGPNDDLSTTLGTIVVPGSPLLAGISTLGGCAFAAAPVTGFIYSGVQHGEIATSAPVGSKSGESCATSILGAVATGDASVETAARQGGISTISHVDHKVMSVLGVYAEYCTVVHGQ